MVTCYSKHIKLAMIFTYAMLLRCKLSFVGRLHLQSAILSQQICKLLQMASSDDLDNDIDELLNDFEANCQRSLLHCVLFY